METADCRGTALEQEGGNRTTENRAEIRKQQEGNLTGNPHQFCQGDKWIGFCHPTTTGEDQQIRGNRGRLNREAHGEGRGREKNRGEQTHQK